MFSMDWTLNARQNMMGGNHVLTVKRAGTVKCLEVLFDTELTGKPQLRAAMTEFKIMAAVATQRASPELIKAVLESSLLSNVAS